MDILLALAVIGVPVLLAVVIIAWVSRKETIARRNRAPITVPHNTAGYSSLNRAHRDETLDQGPDLLTTVLVMDALTPDEVPAEVRKHEPEPAPYEAPPSFTRHYEVDNTPSTTYDDSHSRSTSWGGGSSSSYDSGSSSSSDSSSSWD